MDYGVCGVYRKGQEGLDDGIRRAWVIWTCGRLLAEVAYHAAAGAAGCLAGLPFFALIVLFGQWNKETGDDAAGCWW